MKTPDQIQEEQSQRIFWVIQTIFAFIIARSLLEYKDCLLDPFSMKYYLALLGLIFVYVTVLWSWIDYSYTTIVSPYRFDTGILEKFRFLSDLFIVILYSYLLFSIDVLQKDKMGNLSNLFFLLFIIFLSYLLSGVLRIIQYGKRASRTSLIIIFCILYLILYFFYNNAYSLHKSKETLNLIFITIAALLMFAYRIARIIITKRKTWIAVDVDGVIADQVTCILPIINKRFDSNLAYQDVKEWDLKIGDTDIATLIKEQQKNRKYILSMSMIGGARNAMEKLIKKNKIVIVTARSPETDSWTKIWLRKNDIPFDHYMNLKEGNKHNTDIEANILIDDYLFNVEKFLENSDGKAILFSQPWNQNYDFLRPYIAEGRLKIVSGWGDIIKSIESQSDKSFLRT